MYNHYTMVYYAHFFLNSVFSDIVLSVWQHTTDTPLPKWKPLFVDD